MNGVWPRIAAELAAAGRLARVSIVAARGSTPREVGAAMVVRPDGGFFGTIGGGALEFRALALARAALDGRAPAVALHETVLGPDLGQCCGGRVTLAVERLEAAALPEIRALARAETDGAGLLRAVRDGERLVRRPIDGPAPLGLAGDGSIVETLGEDRRPLLLFGAGHVGRALVLALAPLPFRVDWIDDRDDAFPAHAPAAVRIRRLADPLAAFVSAPAGAFVVALTHDHARDLAIVDAALRRLDVAYVGVIGSKTKRARFSSRLAEMGHTDDAIRRMVCPIGASGPRSKLPAAIAAAVAVELLVVDERVRRTDSVRPAVAVAVG